MTDNPRMSTASAERDDGGNGQDMDLDSMQGGEKTKVRHIKKFPIRLNLQRGESVAVLPELFERKATGMNRKQTVNMKKSTIGDEVIS